MATTRGTRTATRREQASGFGGGRSISVLIRVECHVCGGYGMFGSGTEGRALDYAELIEWHPECQTQQASA